MRILMKKYVVHVKDVLITYYNREHGKWMFMIN